MTIDITGPDKSSFQFPDGTSEATITAAMAQHYGAPAATVDPKAADETAINAVGTNRASTLANIRETPLIGSSLPKATAYLNAAAAKLGIDPGAGMAKTGTLADMAAANEPVLTKGADAYQRQHPIETAIGGMAAGTGLLAPVGAVGLGAKALGMTGLAKTAIPLGSATGAAIGAGDAVTRGEDPITGGVVGGVTAGLGVFGGKVLGKGYDAVRGALRPGPVVPHTIDVNGRQVPADQAIVSGSPVDSTAKQAYEADPATSQMARDSRAATEAGMQDVHKDFASDVSGPGITQPHTARSAAQSIQDDLLAANESSKAGVKAAYDAAGAAPGEYNPSLIQNTPKVVRAALGDPADKVILDELTPRGTAAMGYLDKELGQMNLTTNEAGMPLKIGPDGRPMAEPITPNVVEQVRKNLNRYSQQAAKDDNAADVRAVTRIKTAFDNHITNATTVPGGFTGDAAEVLRLQAEARAAHAAHKANFSAAAPGDTEGKIIVNIIGKHGVTPLTDEQIVPRLFGPTNGSGGTGSPAKLVDRLKGIFGDNSPQVDTLRSGMFSHLADMPVGMKPVAHQEMANRINKMAGSNLGQTIYTPQQLARAQNVAAAHRQLMPVPGTINATNSGNVTVRGMKAGAKMLAKAALPIIGAYHAGPVGFAVGLAGQKAASAIVNRNARKAAERFFIGQRAKALESQLPQRFGALGGYLAADQSR